MTNDAARPEITSNSHTYKLKPWIFLLNLFILVLCGLMIGMPLAYISAVMASTVNTDPNYRTLSLGLLCVFAPVGVIVVLALLQLVVSVISLFFSSVKITPEGVENRTWPYRHIRSRWAELDRLGKFLFYEVIYLKSFTVMGPSLALAWPWKYFSFTQPAINLSVYQGWPGGPLADDLKRYAPQLFEKQPEPAAEGGQPQQAANAGGVPQEDRQLAALAHGSVLIAPIGIFAPLVIYAGYKKKSAYIAYHALQAFFYQLAGLLLGFILPFCLIGVVMVLIFGAGMTGKAELFAPTMTVTMIIAGAFMTLLILVSLAYMVYGLLGAVKTYQGKDFHYALIGRWMGKNPT